MRRFPKYNEKWQWEVICNGEERVKKTGENSLNSSKMLENLDNNLLLEKWLQAI